MAFRWCQARQTKSIIRADNGRPHIAQPSAQFFEQNGKKTSPILRIHLTWHHPTFTCFCYVKGCLADLSFGSADELLEGVQSLLEAITKGTLQVVFLEWMDRWRKDTATNGEYTD
jgi:hypothetical protein